MALLTNWPTLHALGDRYEPLFEEAWEEYLDVLRARAKPAEIEVGRIGVDEIAPAGELATYLAPIYARAMRAGLEELRHFRGLPLGDADWREIGLLITNIDEGTRDGVRDAIRTGLDTGTHPHITAKDIQGIVGLTPRQVGAYFNYGSALTAANKSPEQVGRQTERYKNRLLRERARTIARTESMRALNMAQLRQWEEALERGQLLEDTRKVWIVTPDDRLCERCRAMGRAEPTPLKEEFKSANGDVALHPPLHPKCRCGQGLEVIDVDADYVRQLIAE